MFQIEYNIKLKLVKKIIVSLDYFAEVPHLGWKHFVHLIDYFNLLLLSTTADFRAYQITD